MCFHGIVVSAVLFGLLGGQACRLFFFQRPVSRRQQPEIKAFDFCQAFVQRLRIAAPKIGPSDSAVGELAVPGKQDALFVVQEADGTGGVARSRDDLEFEVGPSDCMEGKVVFAAGLACVVGFALAFGFACFKRFEKIGFLDVDPRGVQFVQDVQIGFRHLSRHLGFDGGLDVVEVAVGEKDALDGLVQGRDGGLHAGGVHAGIN